MAKECAQSLGDDSAEDEDMGFGLFDDAYVNSKLLSSLRCDVVFQPPQIDKDLIISLHAPNLDMVLT